MSFHVGQKVVCVNAEARFDETERLFLGAIYTVVRCFVDDDGDMVVHLLEVRRGANSRRIWGDAAGYGAFRFRPIVSRKTDIAIFQRMLLPQGEDA